MKLLVSDFDGTFDSRNSKSAIDKNIEAIKRFRDQGNIFAIATGRHYESIRKKIEKYQIPYDYLVCADGISTFVRALMYVLRISDICSVLPV